MQRLPQRTGLRSAHMVGLLSVASLVGSLPAATWTESFEGRFSKDFFVEPQEMGGGWSNVRINPASGYSGNAGEVSLVKTPARKGTGAMMCVRGEKGRRMEFELVNRDENDSPRLNQHCWSAISILVPEGSMTHSGMVIQWHGGVPNAAQGKEYAQGPEACLRLDNGQFIYRTNYKDSKQSDPGNRTATLVEKVKPGAWYDFVFHQYFSLTDDGLTEIWVNGRKVYTQKGSNAFYYRGKFAFKFGSYGSGTGGTLFFDEARVITGAGSYEQVALMSGHALQPNVSARDAARDAAINAGDFTSYFAKLTAWLDRQVPADPAQITKKTTQALLGDPAFMAALAERHFMAKIWGPHRGMGNLNAFAKAGPKNKEFLRWVMSNGNLMDEVLLTCTPSAMFARKDDSHDLNAGMLENWQQIYATDPASRQGLYLRLAVACVLRPPGTGNQGAGNAKQQSSVFDRYMYFRRAHANKELMPSFDTLTAWELTHVVSSGASNEDLTWGRDALNTWNPSFRENENVVAMTSQVWYRNGNGVPYHDMSLVMGAGGKCGPRSSFGVFINQAFGIPAIGVAQPAHAAVCWRNRNGDWQIGYGRGWNVSKVADRFNMSGDEFLEVVKERKTPKFGQIEHLRWLASLIESPTSPYLIPASQQYAKARATAVIALWQTLPKAYGKIENTPFARKADRSAALNSLAAPQSEGDYYFARVRGFVHPPRSGDYVFAITSDDDSDLFLSTDEDPDNAMFITHVSGWSDPKDFGRKSQPVRLEGGKKYYIEAIHRELDGGDHLSVAWKGPGVAEGTIPGADLSPYPSGGKGSIFRDVWLDKAENKVPPAAAKPELKPEAPVNVVQGGIHVEAENFFTQGNVVVMDCYTGGKQVYFPAATANAWCGYNIRVPKTGTYQFTARVAAVNWGQSLYVRSFGAMYPVKSAKASNVYRGDVKNLGPQQAIDQDLGTRWAMDFGKDQGWIELDLGQPREISKLIIDERALNYIKKHTVEYKIGGEWKTLLEGTYVKDYVKSFPPVTAQHVRFSSFDTDAPTGGPTIRDFSVGNVFDGNGFIEIPWSPGTLEAAKLLIKDEPGGLSGRWQTTKPLDMYLVAGEQKLWVCAQTTEAQRSVAFRWFELKSTGIPASAGPESQKRPTSSWHERQPPAAP
jgi:hypothetical protein